MLNIRFVKYIIIPHIPAIEAVISRKEVKKKKEIMRAADIEQKAIFLVFFIDLN